MVKPDVVGPKILYLNPSSDNITSADVGNIKTDISTDLSAMGPYAYTSTVAEHYDSFNFRIGPTVASLADLRRVAFGLFLSAPTDNRKYLFQVSGRALLNLGGTGVTPRSGFFFGRKATNNTVTSSKAGASNTLDKWQTLPCNSIFSTAAIDQNIKDEIYALNLSGGFVYCFGFFIDNLNGGSNALTMKGTIDLQFRKYVDVLDVYRPVA